MKHPASSPSPSSRLLIATCLAAITTAGGGGNGCMVHAWATTAAPPGTSSSPKAPALVGRRGVAGETASSAAMRTRQRTGSGGGSSSSSRPRAGAVAAVYQLQPRRPQRQRHRRSTDPTRRTSSSLLYAEDGALQAAATTLLNQSELRVNGMKNKSNKNSSKNSEESGKKEKVAAAGLTRAEEIEYSFRIRTFRAAVRLRDQVSLERKMVAAGSNVGGDESTLDSSGGGKGDEEVSEEDWAEACGTSVVELRRILREGRNAREALAEANAGLVASIAKRQYGSLKYATEAGGGVGTILTLRDLIQEGNLGLMEAAERYDPGRGARFSTYATYWIRQRVLRSISDSSRTIRLPAHVHATLQKISRARARLQELWGREPSLPELAHEVEMSVDRVRRYSDSARNVVSLELPLRNGGTQYKDDTRTIGDVVASDAPTPYEDAETSFLKSDIRNVLEMELADRERLVLTHRFGLDDGKPRTVEETARKLDMSRERVRLVEAKALNKLRSPQRNYRLKEYVASAVPAGAGAGADDEGDDEEHAMMLEMTGAAVKASTAIFGSGEQGQPAGADRMWFF